MEETILAIIICCSSLYSSIIIFIAFNHVLCGIRDKPVKQLGYKKLAILPSILFIDPCKNSYANLVTNVQLILADDYSQFAIGTFPGKYKETEIHLMAEAEGIEEEKEKELRQKLFS